MQIKALLKSSPPTPTLYLQSCGAENITDLSFVLSGMTHVQKTISLKSLKNLHVDIKSKDKQILQEIILGSGGGFKKINLNVYTEEINFLSGVFSGTTKNMHVCVTIKSIDDKPLWLNLQIDVNRLMLDYSNRTFDPTFGMHRAFLGTNVNKSKYRMGSDFSTFA